MGIFGILSQRNFQSATLLFFLLVLFSHQTLQAQVTFFSENVGTSPTTVSIAAYTGWQNEAPVTFAGDADVRNTLPSSGYPAASGLGNVYFAPTIGRNLTISGINTSQYSNIVLKVGHYKNNLTSSNELFIEVSTDGVNYTPLTYTRPTGSGSASWLEITPTGTIPSTPNLRIRFRQTSALTQFRIDDIRLIGIPNPCDVTVTSFSPVSGPAGTEVTINGTNFTGATEVRFNGLSQPVFEYMSSTQIKARVPEGATTGPITVFTDCGGTSAADFVVIDLDCPYSGSGLIISELCDPKNDYQTDRYIEIYNPGSTTVNLNGWEVRAIANGTITANCGDQHILCWTLSGTIQPGEALTCGYTNPLNGGPHDFTDPQWIITDPDNDACYNWNGQERDGAALYNGGVRIDAILKANTSTNYYNDRSLIRNPNICSPDPDSPASDWTVTTTVSYAGVAPSTPGSHQTDCAVSSPVINTHPIDQSICATESITMTVAASGGMPAYNHKWKVYTGSGNWHDVTNGGNYSGANTASLTITNTPASFDGYQYYCEVYNNDNSCFRASNAAIISVSPKPTPSPIWHY